MHSTRIPHRLAALAASLALLAAVPIAAQASSNGSMKHHPAMKKHHAMKHKAMKHPSMKG
jgi:Spy/CpxP family protein refolding chaperone